MAALQQISPYEEEQYRVDTCNIQLCHRPVVDALAALRPKNKYAALPYLGAFGWQEVMDRLRDNLEKKEQEWGGTEVYIIAFRSKRREVNNDGHTRLLEGLDRASVLEAVQSGGLLKYWFGTPDAAGYNLATCKSCLASYDLGWLIGILGQVFGPAKRKLFRERGAPATRMQSQSHQRFMPGTV